MSLTSRFTNLFSSGSTNNTTLQDRNRTALGEDGLPGGGNTHSVTGLGTDVVGSETMAQKALEEEARPPYLHVWKLSPACKAIANFCRQ